MRRGNNKMTKDMQAAAVRAAVAGGKSLEDVESSYPDLADGVAAVRGEHEKPPARRGSGSSRPVASELSRPSLL